MYSIESPRSPIIATEAYRFAFGQALRNASTSCLLLSAYLTKNGLNWIDSCALKKDVAVSIVCRWSPQDLIAGASDVESYWIARSRGWQFRILPDLHAKLFLIDDKSLFIGSANITAHGLSLVPGANREVGVCLEATPQDVSAAWALYHCAIQLTDEVVREISAWIASADIPTKPSDPASPYLKWPSHIRQSFSNDIAGLWVADLPWTTATDISLLLGSIPRQTVISPEAHHDIALYQAEADADLKRNFASSVAFRWLVRSLSTEPNQCAQFGRLTQLLHSALLDDPTPYRKDVKGLLANLLSYSEAFAQDVCQVDRPNYSQRIQLRM